MYCLNYFMKSSHMALISMENVTVCLLRSPVHPCLASCSKICMTIVSLLLSSLVPANFSSWRSPTPAQPLTDVPGCLQSAEHQVSVSRGETGKSLQTSCGNICREMESGWKCIPPLSAAVSSTESWPASQSDSLLSHATNRDAYPDLNLSIHCQVFCWVSCCELS